MNAALLNLERLANLGGMSWTQLAWTQFWQVTIVGAVVLLVVRMFCRRRPYLAYMLLMLVVVKCVVPPLWSSPAGLFSWAQQENAEPVPETLGIDMSPIDMPPTAEFTMSAATSSAAMSSPDTLPPETMPAAPVVPALAEPSRPALTLPAWPALLIGVWAGGAVLCALVITVGWYRQYRMIRHGCVPATGEVLALATRLAAQLRLRRQPRLWISQGSETQPPFGPLCFGIVRPTVVLPDSLVADGSLDQLTPILAHELVHLRRGDTLAAAVQVWVTALWWFHPLVWLTARQLSRQREKCCDQAVVVTTGCAPEHYAQGVLNVLRLAKNLQPMYLASGIRPVDVTGQRLEAIMSPEAKLRARTPWFCWVALIMGTILLLPGKGLVVGGEDTAATEGAVAHSRHDEAANVASMNNLKNIALALLNYDPSRGQFPAAASRDTDGKPLLSWRVHILPFLPDGEGLYKQFRLDEAWDSPHNLPLVKQMPDVFRSPATRSAAGKTNYLGVAGMHSIFGGDTGTKLHDIVDGTSNTLLVVEADDELAVAWTRPRDFEFDPQQPGNGLRVPETDSTLVALADGSVRRLPKTISDRGLLAIYSKDQRDTVDWNTLEVIQHPGTKGPSTDSGGGGGLRLGGGFAPPAVMPPNKAIEISSNKLKTIGLALLNYHITHKHFPAAASRDADGKPLLSWRVHVLPFIGETDLYERFRLGEPWDSPHNRELIVEMPEVFRSAASDSAPGTTSYLGVIGEHTIFTPDTGTSVLAIRDGTSNTAIVVDANNELAVEWTRPGDYDFDPKQPGRGIVPKDGSDIGLVVADGSEHRLPGTVSNELLRALFSMNQGETIDWETLKAASDSVGDNDREKTHRLVFVSKPGMAQDTSWTALSRSAPVDGKPYYMLIAQVTLGGSFPVKLNDEKLPSHGHELFEIEMTDGSDEELTVVATRPDGTQETATLVRDQPVDIEVADETYSLSYGTSKVDPDQPTETNKATIIVSWRPEGDGAVEDDDADKTNTGTTSTKHDETHGAAVDKPANSTQQAALPTGPLAIHGRCEDGDGNPVSDAAITLVYTDRQAYRNVVVARTQSASDGSFHFTNAPRLPRDDMVKIGLGVTAQSSGRASAYSDVPGDGSQEVLLTLHPPQPIGGRVTDNEGRPIAGAYVRYGLRVPQIEGLAAAYTDQDGHFRIDDISENGDPEPESNYGILTAVRSWGFHLTAEGFVSQTHMYTERPESPHIETEPSATITGRVLSADTGSPVVGARITVTPRPLGKKDTPDNIPRSPDGAFVHTPGAQTHTDSSGRYRATGVRGGPHRVLVSADEFPDIVLRRLPLQVGETYEAEDVRLVRGGTIVGRLVDADTGETIEVSEKHLSLSIRAGLGPRGDLDASVRVQPDGTFRARLLPGKHHISVNDNFHFRDDISDEDGVLTVYGHTPFKLSAGRSRRFTISEGEETELVLEGRRQAPAWKLPPTDVPSERANPSSRTPQEGDGTVTEP